MKKNEKCKIVQDLLPSYVDKVTDNFTNNFIEEHLQECDECKNILNKMGENLILDKVDEMKKINYLKKIKLKHRIAVSVTIIIGILIAIILVFLEYRFFTNGQIIYDVNTGKPLISQSINKWWEYEKELFHTSKNSKIIPAEITNIIA